MEKERMEKTIVMKYIEFKEELDYLRDGLKHCSESVLEQLCMEISFCRSKVNLLLDLIIDMEIDISTIF